MRFSCETYDDVIEEIKPLLEEHYEEIAKYKDIPLVPDWSTYRKLEQVGVLKIFTCRQDDRLIGYGIYFIKPHLHYSTCLVAQQDILFITKGHRGTGFRFINWCDEQLKSLGVNLTVQHIKASHNFGAMLERQGYELMDLIYTKRLDK